MPPTLANRAPEVFRTAHVSRRATTGWIVESEDGLAYTGGLLALTDLPPILRARRRRAANGRIRWLLSNVPACFRGRPRRGFPAGAEGGGKWQDALAAFERSGVLPSTPRTGIPSRRRASR